MIARPAVPAHSLFGMLFVDFVVFSPCETGFTTRNRNRGRKIPPFPAITQFLRFVRQKFSANRFAQPPRVTLREIVPKGY